MFNTCEWKNGWMIWWWNICMYVLLTARIFKVYDCDENNYTLSCIHTPYHELSWLWLMDWEVVDWLLVGWIVVCLLLWITQAKSIERIRWLVLGLCLLPFCNQQEIIITKWGWLFKVSAPWSATSLPFHSYRSDVAIFLLIWILNTLSLSRNTALLCEGLLCKFITYMNIEIRL